MIYSDIYIYICVVPRYYMWCHDTNCCSQYSLN